MQRRAVIVDEEPIWRESLEQILEDAGFDVVARERSLKTALPAVRQHSPELLVTEFVGLDLLGELRNGCSDLKIVVISHVREPEAIERALAAGVNVYVFKTSHPSDIVTALRQAFEVTFILPNTFLGSRRERVDESAAQASVRDAGLTRRELEMLACIAGGHSNREIARALWVTEQTVKFHLSNIYRKLNASNRTEASHWAHVNGLIPTKPGPVPTGSEPLSRVMNSGPGVMSGSLVK